MVDFCDILRSSDSGQALDRLSAQFGISTDEANAAVEALMPGVSAGLMTRASDLSGFLSLFGAPGAGQPVAAFSDPNSVPIPDAERDAIITRAAGMTGLAPDLLSKMMPVIGSMVIGAIMNSLQSRGLGGILGDLAKAAGPGGLGAILGQVLGGGQGHASPVPPQGSPSAPGGNIDLGRVLEQVLGGGQGHASPVPQQGSPSASGGNIDLGSLLEQVLRGGQPQTTPLLPDEPGRPRGGLEEEIGQILRGTRR